MLLQFCPFWSRGARFGVSMMLCCRPACLCSEFCGVLWCIGFSVVSEEVLFCMFLVAMPTLVPSIVLSSCSFAMCLILGSLAGRMPLESARFVNLCAGSVHLGIDLKLCLRLKNILWIRQSLSLIVHLWHLFGVIYGLRLLRRHRRFRFNHFVYFQGFKQTTTEYSLS